MNEKGTGTICATKVYRLAALRREMGWGEHAVRQAREKGLRLIGFGREKYALGSDVLDFFRQLAGEDKA